MYRSELLHYIRRALSSSFGRFGLSLCSAPIIADVVVVVIASMTKMWNGSNDESNRDRILSSTVLFVLFHTFSSASSLILCCCSSSHWTILFLVSINRTPTTHRLVNSIGIDTGEQDEPNWMNEWGKQEETASATTATSANNNNGVAITTLATISRLNVSPSLRSKIS